MRSHVYLTIAVTAALSLPAAHAGFWSSVFGGVVANTITGSGGRSGANPAKQKSPDAKIQYALYGLGYYNDNPNGNLNSLNTRKAIEQFQHAYGRKQSGILSPNDRQQLLYINELYATALEKKATADERLAAYEEIEKVKRLIREEQ